MSNFILQLVFLSISTIVSIESVAVCPPNDISPCKCYDKSPTNTSQVRCGDSSKDLSSATLTSSLDKLSGDFDILYIHDTTIDGLGSNTVKHVTFKKIFIENNPNLTNIDAKAFNDSVQPTSFVVRNNSKFIGSNIFDLVKAHGKNLVYLELDQNSIGDIPKDALNAVDKSTLQQLKYIRLDNQQGTPKMTSIGESAFANLPKLSQLSLDHNAISTIGIANKPGIDLSSTSDDTQHISIFLNNNDIKADQVTENNIHVPVKGSVGLVLQDNSQPIDLEKSQKLFINIASKSNGKVYLHNAKSPPICNCAKIADILTNIIKNPDPIIKTNIKGIDNCTKDTNHGNISVCLN